MIEVIEKNAIGGYFELELAQGSEYHHDAIKLNSGRHCFEYILRLRHYRKVFIPYYTCDVMLEPIRKLNLDYDFYKINNKLEPDFQFESLSPDDCLLYTNYFGLKDGYIHNLPRLSNIIIDNSQAFFSVPLPYYDAFYSSRKFFGVPDGGYLYTFDKQVLDINLQQSLSYEHIYHLVKRIDLSAEDGYPDAVNNDIAMTDKELSYMSKLSCRIMGSIDYSKVIQRRKDNYHAVHVSLGRYNELVSEDIDLQTCVPMVYSFVYNNSDLRTLLANKRIYIPTYWKNVITWAPTNSFEVYLTKHLTAIPIDQRYGPDTISYICDSVRAIIGK